VRTEEALATQSQWRCKPSLQCSRPSRFTCNHHRPLPGMLDAYRGPGHGLLDVCRPGCGIASVEWPGFDATRGGARLASNSRPRPAVEHTCPSRITCDGRLLSLGGLHSISFMFMGRRRPSVFSRGPSLSGAGSQSFCSRGLFASAFVVCRAISWSCCP